MAKRSEISMAMLPMNNMAEYFEKITGFKKGDEPASETLKVATIDSDKIAIAALNERGELVSDRNTVDNSLKLGGIEAKNYLTINDSETLLTDTHAVSVVSSDEIKSLRDELYQIKGELVKSGILSDNYYYGGYQDPFREGNEKYIKDEITTLAQADGRIALSDITVTDSSDIIVGEYIAVKSNNKTQITRVTDKQGDRLFITPAINGPLDEFSTVYKSLGSYNNGMFIFGEKSGTIVSPDVKQMIIKDGKTRKKIRNLNIPNSGFATTIVTPKSMAGRLKNVEVSLATTGNPGSLTAYVYEITKDGNVLLGASDALSSANGTMSLRELKLSFEEAIDLESNKDYILVLKTSWADDNNKWHIGGFDESCIDNIHKDCFDVLEDIFTPADDLSDMYLALSVSEILENQIEYYKEGMYSCNIKLPTNSNATRARVELKVNREGRFKVTSNPSNLIPSDKANLELVNIDNKDYGSAGIFQTESTIVIGNQIAKVGTNRVNNTSFTLKEATYAPGDSDVYRVGYKVFIKALKTEINYEDSTTPIKTLYSNVVELPLIAIIPGKEAGKEDISSDRLIFEAELQLDSANNYKLLDFNELQAQIVWSTDGVNKQELQTHNELAGKILDVTITTDRAYSKSK